MGNFRDVLIDREANATITEFMRRKIRQRVKDPALAEKLIPTNHGFGTRRVPLESGYYEVFNSRTCASSMCARRRSSGSPPAGVQDQCGRTRRRHDHLRHRLRRHHGRIRQHQVPRGGGSRRLRDKWAEGPRTYLGLQIAGFPNLFTLVGPHNAATFCNIPRCIEQNVDWVTALHRAHGRAGARPRRGHARGGAGVDPARARHRATHALHPGRFMDDGHQLQRGRQCRSARSSSTRAAPRSTGRDATMVAARGYPGFTFG